jgi:hypothetical protein
VAVEPLAHLDLALSDLQHDLILKASKRGLTMRELMKDAGEQGATLKIAKRRLNSLATIQAHSCMANDETHHVEARQNEKCQGHGTSRVDYGFVINRWLVIGFLFYPSWRGCLCLGTSWAFGNSHHTGTE